MRLPPGDRRQVEGSTPRAENLNHGRLQLAAAAQPLKAFSYRQLTLSITLRMANAASDPKYRLNYVSGATTTARRDSLG